MRKRALITGVTGQDGSYLAELLLEKINKRFAEQNDMLREHTALLTKILEILRKESEYGSNRNV